MKKVRRLAVLLLLPVVLLGFLSVGYLRADITSDLVGYWKFDDNYTDSSINSNDGTAHDQPVFVSGKFGSGLYLNGTNHVEVSMAYNFGLYTDGFTVSCWVNATDILGTWENIVGGDNGAFGFTTNKNGGNVLAATKVYVSDSDGSTIGLNESVWHHIVIVSNSSGSNNLNFYIDGVFLNAVTYQPSYGSGTVILGALKEDVNNFVGVIDDMRFYSRALTSSEVADLYNYNPDVTPSPSPSATPVVNGDLTDTEWFVSALLLVLVVVNIVLLAFPFALVRFVFGTLSLALSAIAFGFGDVPLAPYLQVMGLVVSVVCMFLATRARE